MPGHWYLTSALPRALHAAYPLAPLGALLERRVRAPLAVALAFVLLYSNLGHKEVRFLFPVLPLWNLAGAAALQRLWLGRRKSAARRLALLAALAALAAGLALTLVTAAASRHNYPGGDALRQLHEAAAPDAAAAAAAGRSLRVHIGVLPAMTGVSRFGEAGAPWEYSKAEGLMTEQLAQQRFDFLLTDQPQVQGYGRLAAAHGFQQLQLRSRSPREVLRGLLRGQLPVQVVLKPQVFVQRRLDL
jgi:alpha-1,6-mannosyltransferase